MPQAGKWKNFVGKISCKIEKLSLLGEPLAGSQGHNLRRSAPSSRALVSKYLCATELMLENVFDTFSQRGMSLKKEK